MKIIKCILFCCISLILSSCLGEDRSDCPTARLTFSYLGDTNDPAMFANNIHFVTLMVYNKNQQLVMTRELSKHDLMNFQGVTLALASGNYQIICWGNINQHNEQLSGHESLLVGRLHHSSLTTDRQIPTNSHLYYGSYQLEIPEKRFAEGDIRFCGAHINMEIFVRNMSASNAPNKWPVIEAHNLMPQYNMEMKSAMPYATTYYPETEYNTDWRVHQILFQTLNFGDDNPVIINLKDNNGISKCKVDLKQYMADNKISVDDKNEATVPILFEFTDVGVEIKLPEWIVNNVDPETR
ncbi:FimB/Mfa2 family fimbrial subunit [Bacteroides sp. 519]|uniref:FimB/Mfa2 family fimbrial subunit n=1 Tax=Bacteroides sp. 519 TaxID=2302937 RepID=UPI0013D576D6|nr:FimB/Mfa2 family fimbrial subunit [Bacteroides sp. 519]NDV59333.1 hypothetical protein [Bacteroides sp. 519]